MPGLARALSKLGHCSRSQAVPLIRAGQVSLNGRVCRDPEELVRLDKDQITVAGAPIAAVTKVYLMLNKPRGLVTTTSDEQGRPTIYDCLRPGMEHGVRSAEPASGDRMPSPTTARNPQLPPVFPVGRLDKASEGLLLFTNDTAWAARITDPATHLDKTYHVQVNCLVDEPLLALLRRGVSDPESGARFRAKKIQILRTGQKNTWLEITLDEGKNRHIRRLLEAFDIETLRLIRIAIGNLQLGPLPKGQWRELTESEVAQLGPN